MRASSARVPTVGEIARRLGEPVHRVEYIIRSRKIRPASHAGNCRVFSEDDVVRIGSEIQRIDSKKEGGHAV